VVFLGIVREPNLRAVTVLVPLIIEVRLENEHFDLPRVNVVDNILAVNRGKIKNVACVYERVTEGARCSPGGIKRTPGAGKTSCKGPTAVVRIVSHRWPCPAGRKDRFMPARVGGV